MSTLYAYINLSTLAVTLLPESRGFRLPTGEQFPENWLANPNTDKQAKSIYPVSGPLRPDTQYFEVSDNAPTWSSSVQLVMLSYSSSPRPLPGLKFQCSARVRRVAADILQPTDWYVLRLYETTSAIPPTVLQYRSDVRGYSNQLVDAITKAGTVNALKNIMDNQQWPTFS